MTAPRTAVITGVSGQDGVYLARLLAAEGTSVIGTVRPGGLDHPRCSAYLADVSIVELDIRDADGMARLLAQHEPDELYNLAAFSSVGRSWQARDTVAETNAEAVVGLLDVVRAHRDRTGRDIRVFHASSAAVGADNPYAAAKAAAEEAVTAARVDHDLHVGFASLHNHESPLRGHEFVTRKITDAAARISLGDTEPLVLGNLEVSRDWGFAGDFVDAMRRMTRLDEPVDLEIGTGRSHSLADLVEAAFSAAGVSDPWSHVVSDPTVHRPTDIAALVADTAPAQAVLGWQASAPFTTLVATMVAVDIERQRTGIAENPRYLALRTPDGSPSAL